MSSKSKSRRKARSVTSGWRMMTFRTKVLSISGVCAALLVMLAFAERSIGVMSEMRPWATIDTEVVVAGWQADRTDNAIRDITDRIRKLEIKKKLNPREFSREDQSDLDYWTRELRNKKRTLDVIQQRRRPVVER
jgi:hypothetical protein